MATITHSIGSAGGRDYSDPQSWWDFAIPSDLDAAGNDYVGDCYNDAEFVESAVAGVLVMDGVTTGSHRVTLKCGAGQSFRDHAGKATNPQKYDTGVGVGFHATDHRAPAIDIRVPNIILQGLQLKGGRRAVVAYPQSGCIFEYLICETENNQAVFEGVNNDSLIRNCLLIARSGGGDGLQLSNGGTAVNCTIVRPTDWSSSGTGVIQRYGSGLVKNCTIFGFSASFDGNQSGSSANNASDVAISIGSSNQASKTYASQFQAIGDATRDFRLKSGADCINAGVTDSTNAATDIIGTARPSGAAYDIGCWEFVSGGGGPAVFANPFALLGVGRSI